MQAEDTTLAETTLAEIDKLEGQLSRNIKNKLHMYSIVEVLLNLSPTDKDRETLEKMLTKLKFLRRLQNPTLKEGGRKRRNRRRSRRFRRK